MEKKSIDAYTKKHIHYFYEKHMARRTKNIERWPVNYWLLGFNDWFINRSYKRFYRFE